MHGSVRGFATNFVALVVSRGRALLCELCGKSFLDDRLIDVEYAALANHCTPSM
jgi:hypothetical protein